MADLYQYDDNTGIITPESGEVLSNVQAEYIVAFGSGLSLDGATPQGKLIASDTLLRMGVIAFNAGIANQINPNLSGGIFLDSLLALMGAERIGSTPTKVPCTLAGVPGTVIPSNSFARDQNNNLFFSTDLVTLDSGGGATDVNFQASVSGPIGVPVGQLRFIVSAVVGWDTITNPTTGTTGTLTQTDSAARRRRKDTLGLQGQSQAEAIIAGLYTVEGVDSVSYRQNDTDDTVTFEGVTLLPHSMYACVAGGLDLDVATMIRIKKNGGCNVNGSVTVDTTEPLSGQVYAIKFDRPDLLPVLIRVTVRLAASVIDPEIQIKQAILAYAAGDILEQPGFGNGDNVSSFEIAGAVASQTTGIYVALVETTLASSVDYSTDEIDILINQRATLLDSSITVIIL